MLLHCFLLLFSQLLAFHSNHLLMVLLTVLAAPVAHELESAKDLADGEETNELSTNDTNTDHLGCAEAAEAAEGIACGAG
jgi:hypothetical protein